MELEELPNVPTHDEIVPVAGPKKDSPEKARLGMFYDVLWMYDCVSFFLSDLCVCAFYSCCVVTRGRYLIGEKAAGGLPT